MVAKKLKSLTTVTMIVTSAGNGGNYTYTTTYTEVGVLHGTHVLWKLSYSTSADFEMCSNSGRWGKTEDDSLEFMSQEVLMNCLKSLDSNYEIEYYQREENE